MAYFCPECKIIFNSRAVNCPCCGYGIASDNKQNSFYLNQGYSVFNSPRTRTEITSAKIDDDDILNKLRGRYTEFVNEKNPSAISSVQPLSEEEQESPPSDDFFGAFKNNEIHTPETTVEPEPEYVPVPSLEESTQSDQYYIPRRRPFSSFRTRPFQVPWRAIMCLAVFVVFILIIAVIWSLRFVILESILNFLTALLPIAIIIGVIVYLIRSLFR